ncbi:MAG: adenylyl-sulfate kinase, partial [Patescibacteria group bacterium]|nr:adenylyl-sulfate kinase [Patescibacteria group bacterium]
HPGVRWINSLNPVLLGGKISLIRRRESEHKEYELTPRQVRRMFEERGWSRVVGFHTRNVIHKSHEFIQLEAMRRANADGLFVHPVIGKKKPGDFHAKYIIGAYEQMVKHFYPRDKVVFATYATFSRYAGPREAIFTALCRKNFGCSHFVVGRDHTGVGDFYHPKASHEIFDRFSDLGIEPIRFDKVFYSNKLHAHVHEADDTAHSEEEKMHISGTQARKMFEQGERPPEWFMRLEISEMIISSVARGEEVFVRDETQSNCGTVLWFTGLSGSGKSTIAQELAAILETQGKRVCVLDGDAVRAQFKVQLGFSREDIRENNRRIAELAKEEARRFDVVVVPIISPYAEDRAMARAIIGDGFTEVFVNASLEACMARDTKGLYGRAKRGEMDNLIGFSPNNPYEAPENPDVEVKTDALNPEEGVSRIINFLRIKNKI